LTASEEWNHSGRAEAARGKCSMSLTFKYLKLTRRYCTRSGDFRQPMKTMHERIRTPTPVNAQPAVRSRVHPK